LIIQKTGEKGKDFIIGGGGGEIEYENI